MLKIVVFDSGVGGEIFAERLQDYLPVVQIIKVIDWRHADKYMRRPREARRYAAEALRPYIGHADLIVFANQFLTATSLKYFRRHYGNQLFTGLGLQLPDTFRPRATLIMATSAISHTVAYHNYVVHMRRPVVTLCPDEWIKLIDDGELTHSIVKRTLNKYFPTHDGGPYEVILACAHFCDIKDSIRRACGWHGVKIYDGFNDCYRDICQLLKIRGGLKKLK